MNMENVSTHQTDKEKQYDIADSLQSVASMNPFVALVALWGLLIADKDVRIVISADGRLVLAVVPQSERYNGSDFSISTIAEILVAALATSSDYSLTLRANGLDKIRSDLRYLFVSWRGKKLIDVESDVDLMSMVAYACDHFVARFRAALLDEDYVENRCLDATAESIVGLHGGIDITEAVVGNKDAVASECKEEEEGYFARNDPLTDVIYDFLVSLAEQAEELAV